MVKPSPESGTNPTNFPNTTPSTPGPDIGMWLLKANTELTAAVAKIETNLGGLREQLDRIETKVSKIASDVEGHGKWIHTVKVVLGAIGALLAGLIIAVVGPWLKAKIFG